MNNNWVYLPELDSVCKSEDEMKYALTIMYAELILKGNVIVLTMNQFVDSHLFHSIIANAEMRRSFESLFQHQRIIISKFKFKGTEYDNVLKYICKKLADAIVDSTADVFIFSLFDFGNTFTVVERKYMLQALLDALLYNDIFTLHQKLSAIPYFPQEKIDKLCDYARFIITISVQSTLYLKIISFPSITLYDCLKTLIACKSQVNLSDDLAKNLESVINSCNSTDITRSFLYNIIETSTKCKIMKHELLPWVDLCYNVTCACSIAKLKSFNDVMEHITEFHTRLTQPNFNGKSSFNMRKSAISGPSSAQQLTFSEDDINQWESAARTISAFDALNQKDSNLSWIQLAKKYTRYNVCKALIRFVGTLISLSAINLFMNILSDKFKPNSSHSICMALLLAAILAFFAVVISDLFSYALKLTNLFEILFDKNRKQDKETCKRIKKGDLSKCQKNL